MDKFIVEGGRADSMWARPLPMIELTRLNGKAFSLNALYIETIESFPDTTITLTTGRKYVALESEQEVHEKIIHFYKQVQLLSNPHLRGDKDEE